MSPRQQLAANYVRYLELLTAVKSTLDDGYGGHPWLVHWNDDTLDIFLRGEVPARLMTVFRDRGYAAVKDQTLASIGEVHGLSWWPADLNSSLGNEVLAENLVMCIGDRLEDARARARQTWTIQNLMIEAIDRAVDQV